MPRFYFHIREGNQLHRDEEGFDLSSAHQAMAWAFEALSAMPSDDTDGMVQITDEGGRAIIALPLAFSGRTPRATRH